MPSRFCPQSPWLLGEGGFEPAVDRRSRVTSLGQPSSVSVFA
ncbi:MAG: hypothetical protein ACFB12_14805 [Leptolyngbyaceae cyanobacterium]